MTISEDKLLLLRNINTAAKRLNLLLEDLFLIEDEDKRKRENELNYKKQMEEIWSKDGHLINSESGGDELLDDVGPNPE